MYRSCKSILSCSLFVYGKSLIEIADLMFSREDKGSIFCFDALQEALHETIKAFLYYCSSLVCLVVVYIFRILFPQSRYYHLNIHRLFHQYDSGSISQFLSGEVHWYEYFSEFIQDVPYTLTE